MAANANSGKKNWEKLAEALKNEIELMREVLSNLHQEELALLENDRKKWTAVMEQRSDHVLNLKQIRNERMSYAEELLPVFEEGSCEILSKLDQIFALVDRMNLQNCRNEVLFQQSKQKKELPLHCPYPHPLHKAVRKTKTKTFQ